jgi:hypothetical protein
VVIIRRPLIVIVYCEEFSRERREKGKEKCTPSPSILYIPDTVIYQLIHMTLTLVVKGSRSRHFVSPSKQDTSNNNLCKKVRREYKHSRHDCLTKSPQHGSIQTTTKQDDETLIQLRQRRLDREACENARAQSILGHQDNTKVQMDDDRGRGYHDQWNPMLSRK